MFLCTMSSASFFPRRVLPFTGNHNNPAMRLTIPTESGHNFDLDPGNPYLLFVILTGSNLHLSSFKVA